MKAPPLNLLVVEDSDDDLRLIERTLIRSGLEFQLTRVADEPDLRQALMWNRFELAITDHVLPGFDSSRVLEIINELAPTLPCILVSGKVGEEAVADAMSMGAADYVAKDNLARLPTVVERTLSAAGRKHERELSRDALLRSGQLFEAVFANSRDALIIFDDERQLIDLNAAAGHLFGLSKEEAFRLKLDELAPELAPPDGPDFWKKFLEVDQRRGETDIPQEGDGMIPVEYSIGAGFMPGRHIIVLRDISDRRRVEAEALRRARQQKTIAGLSEQALRGTSLEPLFDSTVEQLAETMDAEIAGVLELRPDADEFEVRSTIGMGEMKPGHRSPFDPPSGSQASFTMGQEGVVTVVDYRTEDRFSPATAFDQFEVRSGISVSIPGETTPFGVLGCVARSPNAFSQEDAAFLTAAANLLADAVNRDRREQETRKRALHDPLTGLANRTLFKEHLERALEKVARNGTSLAIVSLDLDDFKSINDTFGHRAGDELLIQVGDRINDATREQDLVARFGGDEFVVLSTEISGEEEAVLLAERLLSMFAIPFSIDGDESTATRASIGIAVTRETKLDAERLLHDADIALYRSKEHGRSTWTLATDQMRAEVLEKSEIKQALDLAIGTGQFYVDFQPIVDLTTGKLYAVEALARWRHPVRGMIPPGVFIPIAEQSGLILRVGEWVLREACRQAGEWRSKFGGSAPPPINVNISAQQVARVDLAGELRRFMLEAGAEPEDICLELTESVLIGSLGEPMKKLAELRRMGVGIVLDDFGTGYSSLSYLERFPIDMLKIDRSFVTSLDMPEIPAPVVAAIISLSKALGVSNVAEGIETADQAASVMAMGCRYGQGYFYGRPGPPEAISALIRDDSPLKKRYAEACAVNATGVTGS